MNRRHNQLRVFYYERGGFYGERNNESKTRPEEYSNYIFEE